MNSVSKCFNSFFPLLSTLFRQLCLVVAFVWWWWRWWWYFVVVVIVGSKAIHKHSNFIPKIRLQSECVRKKWGANLKHTHTHTHRERKIQEYNDTKKKSQSQSSCHKKKKKLFSHAWSEISIHLILYLCICNIYECMTNRVFWDVINVDTRLEDLRGITAININIITLQHTHTHNTSKFWFLKKELHVFSPHHSMMMLMLLLLLIFFIIRSFQEILIAKHVHTNT